jgi:hypothetical protein
MYPHTSTVSSAVLLEFGRVLGRGRRRAGAVRQIHLGEWDEEPTRSFVCNRRLLRSEDRWCRTRPPSTPAENEGGPRRRPALACLRPLASSVTPVRRGQCNSPAAPTEAGRAPRVCGIFDSLDAVDGGPRGFWLRQLRGVSMRPQPAPAAPSQPPESSRGSPSAPAPSHHGSLGADPLALGDPLHGR